MATSPDYLRLATSATRSLAETAFDSVRDSVLVVDARIKHLPVVCANVAARGCLGAGPLEGETLIDSSLFGLLAPASAADIDAILASLRGSPVQGQSGARHGGSGGGETALMTELKLLDSAQGHRLVMLTFAASSVDPDLASAVEQLPFDLMIFGPQSQRHIRQSGCGAFERRDGKYFGMFGADIDAVERPARRKFTVRALEGCHYHDVAVELPQPDCPGRAASRSTCSRSRARPASLDWPFYRTR